MGGQEAAYERGLCLAVHGELDQALDVFIFLSQGSEPCPAALLGKACILLCQEQYEKALAAAGAASVAMRNDPPGPATNVLCPTLHMEFSKYSTCVSWRSLWLFSRQPEAGAEACRRAAIGVLLELERLDEARELLIAAKKNSSSAESRLFQAQALACLSMNHASEAQLAWVDMCYWSRLEDEARVRAHVTAAHTVFRTMKSLGDTEEIRLLRAQVAANLVTAYCLPERAVDNPIRCHAKAGRLKEALRLLNAMAALGTEKAIRELRAEASVCVADRLISAPGRSASHLGRNTAAGKEQNYLRALRADKRLACGRLLHAGRPRKSPCGA